jgi:hypothetical protein
LKNLQRNKRSNLGSVDSTMSSLKSFDKLMGPTCWTVSSYGPACLFFLQTSKTDLVSAYLLYYQSKIKNLLVGIFKKGFCYLSLYFLCVICALGNALVVGGVSDFLSCNNPSIVNI